MARNWAGQLNYSGDKREHFETPKVVGSVFEPVISGEVEYFPPPADVTTVQFYEWDGEV